LHPRASGSCARRSPLFAYRRLCSISVGTTSVQRSPFASGLRPRDRWPPLGAARPVGAAAAVGAAATVAVGEAAAAAAAGARAVVGGTSGLGRKTTRATSRRRERTMAIALSSRRSCGAACNSGFKGRARGSVGESTLIKCFGGSRGVWMALGRVGRGGGDVDSFAVALAVGGVDGRRRRKTKPSGQEPLVWELE